MARRPGARLGDRDAAAVGVEREDNRASDVFEGQKKMRWCEERRVESNAHTHSPGKGKSERKHAGRERVHPPPRQIAFRQAADSNSIIVDLVCLQLLLYSNYTH
jgi:hypothetical protein